jgi:hypothetical protein
LTAEIN